MINPGIALRKRKTTKYKDKARDGISEIEDNQLYTNRVWYALRGKTTKYMH